MSKKTQKTSPPPDLNTEKCPDFFPIDKAELTRNSERYPGYFKDSFHRLYHHHLMKSGGWVNSETPLADPEELKEIIRICHESLIPVHPDKALKLARLLIGSYPHVNLNQAEIYLRAILSVLSTLPFNLAAKLVDEITLSSHYLPSRSEIHKTAKELLLPITLLKNTAERMLKEHKRRNTTER